MVTRCARCYGNYETTTIDHCPICSHRYADTKDDYEGKEVRFMLATVRGLKSMVSNSTKGKPHRHPGMRIVDPWLNHRNGTIKYGI